MNAEEIGNSFVSFSTTVRATGIACLISWCSNPEAGKGLPWQRPCLRVDKVVYSRGAANTSYQQLNTVENCPASAHIHSGSLVHVMKYSLGLPGCGSYQGISICWLRICAHWAKVTQVDVLLARSTTSSTFKAALKLLR